MVTRLPLPFDFVCDSQNVVIALAKADGPIKVGDHITHIDDFDVRSGCRTISDALNESRLLHSGIAGPHRSYSQ